MKKIILIILAALLVSPSLPGELRGEDYTNDNALGGLKSAKAYFDVTLGEPKKLLLRLQLIETTYNQLLAAGVSPAFTIGIRGKSSNFFTKGSGYVLDIDLAEKKQIETLAQKLKARGINLEQCRIAARFQEIDVADFLPQIKIVANGYVSLIGYQAKGYGLVPMD